MSLSDKYGGNVDSKYGVPQEYLKKYDITKAAVKPGKESFTTSGWLEMGIKNSLDEQHYNIIRDAFLEIDKEHFKSIMDAYEEYELAYGGLIVYSQDMKTPIEIMEGTYKTISNDYGPDDIFIKRQDVFYDDINKYYLLPEEYQKQIQIGISMGTFERDREYIGNLDARHFSIHMYKDGSIYLSPAQQDFNELPIDYCAVVLDEIIKSINNGEYNSFIPKVQANIYYEYIKQENEKYKKYIKRRSLNYPDK